MKSTPIEDILSPEEGDDRSSHDEDVSDEPRAARAPRRRAAKQSAAIVREDFDDGADDDEYGGSTAHKGRSRVERSRRRDEATGSLWTVIKSKEFVQAVVLSSLLAAAINSQPFKQAVLSRVPPVVSGVGFAEVAIFAALTGLAVTLARPPTLD